MRLSLRDGLVFLPLVLSCVMAGCSPSFTTVSGKVSFQGKPVKGGFVVFYSPDGNGTAQGEIKEDGSYKVERVPVGLVKVCVDTSSLDPSRVSRFPKYSPPPGAQVPEGYHPAAGPSREEMTKRFVRIPERYANPDKTDLQTTIAGLSPTYEIELKP